VKDYLQVPVALSRRSSDRCPLSNEVLRGVEEESDILRTVKRREVWLVTSCGGSASVKGVIEENIDEASGRNRKSKKLLDDLNPTVRLKNPYMGCRLLRSFLASLNMRRTIMAILVQPCWGFSLGVTCFYKCLHEKIIPYILRPQFCRMHRELNFGAERLRKREYNGI